MITPLDHSYGAMQGGNEAAGLVFWQAMADATLYMLLTSEAVGAVLSPAVFDLPEGPVVLAFDTEERLAAFSDRPQAYAALPFLGVKGQNHRPLGQVKDGGRKHRADRFGC